MKNLKVFLTYESSALVLISLFKLAETMGFGICSVFSRHQYRHCFPDWYLPATNRIKGRLSMILLVVNALLIHNQLLPEKHWANIPLILAACITLLVYGIVLENT